MAKPKKSNSKVDKRNEKLLTIHKVIQESRQRRNMMMRAFHSWWCIHAYQKKTPSADVCSSTFAAHIRQTCRYAATSPRSCRRLARNSGWLDIGWNTYSEARFKKTFCVSRKTFNYILNRIRGKLERQTITEVPLSPELRLAICLYRLGRGSSGADLGIFVCQSKMTSHFCNDRFHFIFRGGGVLGDAPPQNFLKRSCILRALWSKILKY